MNVREILEQIAADASAGNMVFPSNTELAMRVKTALDDPDCSIDQLGKLIAAEPILSTRLVSIANSVTFNPSGRAVTDARSAISRLGFNTVRVITVAMIVRQMQVSTVPAHRKLAAQLWEHTAHVAALARTIAKRFTHVDPEAAFFAGIVHEIGGFYLIARAGAYDGILEAGLESWCNGGEARVGRSILSWLKVPENTLNALETLWKGYLNIPAQSLGDTLLLANELAPVKSPLLPPTGLAQPIPPAQIDMTLGDAQLSDILADAAEEVASLTGALQS